MACSTVDLFRDELHAYFNFHESFNRIPPNRNGNPYHVYLTDIKPDFQTYPYGNRVIIKELSPTQAKNYQKICTLWNPYLETVYGVLEKESHSISINEFVEAPTSLPWEKPSMSLEEYVTHFGCFSKKDALILLWQIGEAVKALQSIHFTHGDISPQNILLTDTCKWETLCSPLPATTRKISVKLIDFGTSRKKKWSNHRVTQVIGTKPFAAPEILDFRYPTDRVDIYSMGCILYYMLMGKSPKENGITSFQKKLGRGAYRIIKRCTNDYEHRYYNVARLQKEIIRQLWYPCKIIHQLRIFV